MNSSLSFRYFIVLIVKVIAQGRNQDETRVVVGSIFYRIDMVWY